ncbi:MAG: preprotein translocase subunit SecG [Mycoplasmataceae bacterium]|jgi:preprotein translocase subunit SecG|nr:preprotein translocase subunit SecG [Mycoplasmataceae bacterium]
MTLTSILLLVCAVICLIVGLMLSGSGSTTGLTAIIGQDLELFKKTKDRGLVKILQMVMFLVVILMIILSVLFAFKIIP